MFYRETRGLGFVVATPGHIDRIVVQDSESDFARLMPSRSFGHGQVMRKHVFDMAEVMISAGRKRIGLPQRDQLLVR